MEDQINDVTRKRNFRLLNFIILVLLVASLGLGAWNTVQINKDEEPAAKTEATDETDKADNNLWATVVKSGQEGFEVTLPDGWGPLLNDTTADAIIMSGTSQPTVEDGAEVTVTEVNGFGSDSPGLFSILLSDNVAQPEGTASEFNIGKGEDELKGQKYIKEYTEDTEVGISTLRLKGDRDYHYHFERDGADLHVMYSVYGSDPRNQITTVDEIVRYIRLAD